MALNTTNLQKLTQKFGDETERNLNDLKKLRITYKNQITFTPLS